VQDLVGAQPDRSRYVGELAQCSRRAIDALKPNCADGSKV